MADQDPTDQNGQESKRPREDDDKEAAEVAPPPGIDASESDDDAESDVSELADESAVEPDESGEKTSDESGEKTSDESGEKTSDESGEKTSDETKDSDSDDVDWEAMAESKTRVDNFTSGQYLSATTEEYKGLAEAVSRAAEEEWEMQAVAATLPGVESGLVGFEDVSGKVTDSEESYEAVEQAASSDLTMRIASGLTIFGLFLGSLVLGGWWFTAFVILVMVVAVGELYANLRTKDYRPIALFGIVGVILMGVGAHSGGAAAIGGWAALVAVATVLLFSLTPRKSPAENLSVTVLGFAWVGMLSFAILVANGPHPVAYILFVVLLIAFNDIGSYFVGRAFGRRKMAPKVSPNKTIEGFIGGLIVVGVVASILVTFPPWDPIGLAKGLAAAAVVGLFAPLGDLVESMVKRSIEVKDMGSVLPGHGGMLDRIDGFLFAVPAIYFLFRAFELL
ncbi:MAG: phosphatidate cytidylyltransferase [Acidobacteria bacterium]|nr:phosphatidate cytidylyltransferase [Acidobacteriota bacterium]